MGCEWKASTLSVLADIQTGPFGSQLHASDYVVNGIPSIMPQNIGDNIISEQGIARISALDVKRLNRYLVKTGDIVYSRRGDVEKRALIRAHQSGWLCGTGCLRVRPNMEVIDPVFLSYHLGNPLTRAWIVQHAHGATMPNLNTEILSAVPIVVPSMEVQQSIAATLSCLDDKIELNNKINANLEAQAQAIFKSWFVDFEPFQDGEFVDSELGQIPKGWRVVPFTEIVDVLGGGTPKTDVPEYWNGTIPFFTPKDVSGAYTISTQKTLTQQGIKNCNSRLYPQNTVFITARGTVGKVTLAGNNMAMNQSCYALRSKHPYSQYFIYQLTLGVVDALKNKATGAVFDAIVTRDFENETVVLPHIDVITKYTSIVEPMFKLILKNLHESKTLSHIRDGMLPRLMSGEIEIKHLDNRLER
ncbi:MAG: restriction endonuclease subunit S [Candidatus Limiplasma sp.]|nr:restriction endonuclease subunit S [Candidatus Limiplasma sp.]